jgi:multiple sugar transport system permease protein
MEPVILELDVAATQHQARVGRHNLWRRAETYVYMLPAVLFVVIFLLYPAAYTLYISFTDWDGLTAPQFVGLENYLQMFKEPVFGTSVVNTVIWVIVTLLFPVGLGLLLAVFVNRIPLQGFFKAIFYLPYAISATSIAVIWTYMLTPTGIVNELLSTVGLDALTRPWLQMPPWNTITMLMAFTWQTTGTNMILFLVGLQSIPTDLIEAAKLDGANGIQTFRRVILPLLRPITTVVITISVVNSFKVFDLIWIMTQGGPFRSSETLAVTMYRESFVSFRLGFGASIANFLSLIVIVFSIIYLRSIFQPEE